MPVSAAAALTLWIGARNQLNVSAGVKDAVDPNKSYLLIKKPLLDDAQQIIGTTYQCNEVDDRQEFNKIVRQFCDYVI